MVSRNMETNVPGIYAAGDCCNTVTKRMITACGEGSLAAEMAYEYLQEKK